MTPRRIVVEIGSLAVHDPALARPGEVAAALERELASLAVDRDFKLAESGGVRQLSAPLGAVASPKSIGTSVARAIAGLRR